MDKIKSYKKICFKLGLVMSIFFISGIACSVIIHSAEFESETMAYVMRLVFSGVFLYLIPLVAAVAILRNENQSSVFDLYKKPPRLAKALGNFPAVYGLGQITNLIGLFVAFIVMRYVNFNPYTKDIQQQETLERSFGTMNSLIPPNLLCGLILFIHMVFAAAFFEELICRGVLLDALKPYGNGFAIIVTGFFFGIMHGNFQQFFYAFVLGIVFAYITIQTGSILAATILHALFNSLAAGIMLFVSNDTVRDYLFEQKQPTEEGMLMLAGFAIYFALFLGILIAGIGLAIKKLSKLKSYKALNPFPEISARRKALILFTSAPVIIMLILTVDRFAGGIVPSLILRYL